MNSIQDSYEHGLSWTEEYSAPWSSTTTTITTSGSSLQTHPDATWMRTEPAATTDPVPLLTSKRGLSQSEETTTTTATATAAGGSNSARPPKATTGGTGSRSTTTATTTPSNTGAGDALGDPEQVSDRPTGGGSPTSSTVTTVFGPTLGTNTDGGVSTKHHALSDATPSTTGAISKPSTAGEDRPPGGAITTSTPVIRWQTWRPASNGEPLSSLRPSLSSPLDLGHAPSTYLHDHHLLATSSAWPPLLAPASDSQHASSSLLLLLPPPVQDPALLPPHSSSSPAAPLLLPTPAWPRLPHSSPTSMSGWETYSAFPGAGLDVSTSTSGGPGWSSIGSSTTHRTPPLQELLEPSTVVVAPSWDPVSSSSSLHSSFLLHPTDFFFSTVTPSLSHSVSVGFEDWRYTTGEQLESLLPEELVLPEVSSEPPRSTADMDPLCTCSLQPSVSMSWPRDPASSYPYPSTSGVAPSGSVLVSQVLVLDTPLLSVSPSTSTARSDPLVPFSTTASTISQSWFSTTQPNSGTIAQTIDSSSSGASGSALEGLDQDQSSASGELPLFPYSTDGSDTVSLSSSTSGSGQSPDDLEEHSSAFYFESESGSTTPSDVTPATVTSPPSWLLGGDEESGSGQGDALFDNETSSDFSIADRTGRESQEEEEEPVAGKAGKGTGQLEKTRLTSICLQQSIGAKSE